MSKALLFLGSYIDESVYVERRLPSRNVASSNRILRLSQALQSQGHEVTLVASGTALRMGFVSTLLHRSLVLSRAGVKVIYERAIAMPVIGAVLEPFFLSFAVCRLLAQKRYDGVIVYNYPPAIVAAALVARFGFGMPMLLDVEDVCVPRWSDWVRRGDDRPFLQVYGWVLMRIMDWSATAVMCPASGFLDFIYNRRAAVVSGCLCKDDYLSESGSGVERFYPLKVLYGGLLSEENGAYLFLSFLKSYGKALAADGRYEFIVCGAGPAAGELEHFFNQQGGRGFKFHGMVDAVTYRGILKSADVCLVLQNPLGRHSSFKTPSKLYEYMAAGKLVVVTDVGDCFDLPDSSCMKLRDYAPNALMSILGELDPEVAMRLGAGALAYSLGNWCEEKVGRVMGDLIEVNEHAYSII